VKLLHESVSWFIYGSLLSIAALYLVNRLSGRKLGGMDGKKATYVVLVMAIGAGLIVNALLKDGFGRARPKDILEFGGAEHFTPAYYIGSACDRNCSFSSGDTAGAFCALAFVFAAGNRKRAMAVAAVGYGVLVSASRIASGSHFLSDTMVSFFVMLIVSDALYYRMYLFKPEPADLVPAPAPAPAPAVLIGTAEKPSAPL
jgi:lipid A 4'-phosphatase